MADTFVGVTWVADELLTSTKLNQAMANQSNFHNGTALGDGIIVTRHLGSSANLQIPATNISDPYKFSAYRSTSNQNISGNTITRIQLNAEKFDTSNNFDSSTNYRFTAPVAGFYYFHGSVQTLLGTTNTDSGVALYKNGSLYRYGSNLKNGVYPQYSVSGLLQLAVNDYVELWFINRVSADTISSGPENTYFDGFLFSAT